MCGTSKPQQHCECCMCEEVH